MKPEDFVWAIVTLIVIMVIALLIIEGVTGYNLEKTKGLIQPPEVHIPLRCFEEGITIIDEGIVLNIHDSVEPCTYSKGDWLITSGDIFI